MISIIAAVASNRTIGQDNKLLWHLPEDMQHFRETTRNRSVIMGRKTWESIPQKFRPLPGRQNIVISRNLNYDAPGAILTNSLNDALNHVNENEETFVIGGEEIYKQAFPLVNRLYLTEIRKDFDGDAFFPEVLSSDWVEIVRNNRYSDLGFTFSFVVYVRQK